MGGFESFLMGLRIIGQVSEWSEKALADGKVTITEAVDLAEKIGNALGVRLELDLPGALPMDTTEETKETVNEVKRDKRSWE